MKLNNNYLIKIPFASEELEIHLVLFQFPHMTLEKAKIPTSTTVVVMLQ